MNKKVDFKTAFGRLFREARDQCGMSRAALSIRVGVSAKTIQSWEVGRTFIEDLSIIPILDSELDTSIVGMIAKASGVSRYTTAPSPSTRAGKEQDIIPLHLHGTQPDQIQDLEAAFAGVPLLHPKFACVDIHSMKQEHIAGHLVIPRSWVPRGGTLVAYKVEDAAMEPTIPEGAHVVVNRRDEPPAKMVGKILALQIRERLRIRRLTRFADGTFHAQPEGVGRPGSVLFDPENGDRILGRIRGVLAQPF